MDTFKLSEPGNALSQDPVIQEYLQNYGLPMPPKVRYGFVRFESPVAAHRVQLFGQAWMPADAEATVLFIHGFCEHTANYGRLIHDFIDAKFAVASLDLRGHGLSEGTRGHADTTHCYPEDLEAFVKLVFPALTPSRALHIWAHSLGATIGLQLLLRKKLPITPTSAVFSSAFLGFPELKGMNKILNKLAPFAAKILPAMPVSFDLPPTHLTHDEKYLAVRAKDPLIIKSTTPRWAVSAQALIDELQATAPQLRDGPATLFLLAGEELVTNLPEARRFAHGAYQSLRHKVIEFPGYRHEIEKEPDIRERIVHESLAWMKSPH